MYFKNNRKECPHENIGKECYCGTRTGDYICYDCGETFSLDFMKIIRSEKKQLE